MAPRYNLAKRKARQLLAQANVTEAPVPLEKLVAAANAHVNFEPYDGNDMSGVAYREANGQRVIGVNSLHGTNRQRFTIAHELGHLILHGSDELHIDERFPIGFRDELSSLAVSDKEIEANQFAAELLMPAEWILRDVSNQHIDFEGEDDAIDDLARKYCVSTRAMTIRMSALGALNG